MAPVVAPKRGVRKPPPPSLDLTEQPISIASISDTGSLRDGDLSLSTRGLRISADTRGAPSSGSQAGGEAGKEYIGMQREDMEIVRPLGEGSSGVVQLVRHRPTGRLMALKVIRMGTSAEGERKQVLAELRALHRAMQGERADSAAEAAGGAGAPAEPRRVPSIISFFGAFYADGAIHIALELMDRGSLHAMLHAAGPIEERLLACIAVQVLRGLDALQALKIVHRDVKPGNVLLNSAGEIKLADLGMCGELANSLARLRSWVGTAAYMSPERISGADYSFNSDVWSLGVSLWECATGRYPFGTPPGPARAPAAADGPRSGPHPEEAGTSLTFWELLHHIVEGDAFDDPTPGRELLSDFLAQALRRDPAERPDARALLQHGWIRAHTGGPGTPRDWVRDAVARLPVAGADGAAQ